MGVGSAVLERRERLSRSLVWRLQRAFFEQRGLAAWGEEIVPHYITSNPRIAAAYAQVVRAFARHVSPEQRVHIVELGAGSGRFGYRFLNQLHADVPFTYVMTDVSERTLSALHAHPFLQEFIGDGSLDFAYFDAEHPARLCLRHAGRTLEPGAPLVVIANYVFDSLPQDCFAVRDGALYECLVTTRTPAPAPVQDHDDPALLEHIRMSYVERPIDASTYYPDPAHNAVLASYARTTPDGVFLMPIAALGALDYFKALNPTDLVVLTGDKGFHQADEIQGLKYPRLTLHGSFSLMVNFHALGEYARAQAALVLEPRHRPTGLRIFAYAWGASNEAIHSAYEEFIETGGPDDFYALKKAIEKLYHRLDLGQLLSYLRLSGFDSDILLACAPTIHKKLANASPVDRANLTLVLEQVWRAYLPLPGGEGADLAFEIGTLLFKLEHAERALEFFQHSREWWGPDAATAYNTALCLKRLGAVDTARRSVEEALQLQPDFDLASTLRDELLA